MTPRLRTVSPSWSLPADAAGRDIVILNYVLYALGFFTGVTAVLGVALAHWRRRTACGIVRTHLDWQVRVFWWGVVALLAAAVWHVLVVGLGAVTFGVGLVFLPAAWALTAAWAIGTVWAIVLGLRRISRDLPIG